MNKMFVGFGIMIARVYWFLVLIYVFMFPKRSKAIKETLNKMKVKKVEPEQVEYTEPKPVSLEEILGPVSKKYHDVYLDFGPEENEEEEETCLTRM